MSADKFNYSLLKEAFELYNEERYGSREAEAAAVTFSPAFEAKMEKLIRQEKKPYYRMVNTVGKRVAAVVIALLLGLTVTTFSVKALRDPFLRFITQVFEEFTSIVFLHSEAEEEPFAFEKMEPTYIPEGYTVEKVEENNYPFYEVWFTHPQYKSIRYKQQKITYAITAIDTEAANHLTVQMANTTGLLCTNKDTITLTFYTENYKFCLISPATLPEEELIRMAESIVATS